MCSELYQVNLEEFLPKDEKKAFLELENKITHEDLQLMLTDQEKTKKLQKSQKQIAKMNKDLKYIKEIWDFRANTAYHLAFHDELFNVRLKKSYLKVISPIFFVFFIFSLIGFTSSYFTH